MKSSENAKKNKSYMVSELETEMVDAPQNVVYSSGSTEDVRLVRENHGSFVPVYDNTEIFYGGDQNWWPDDSDKENRGCGPAAANITYYFKRIKFKLCLLPT